MSNSAHIATTDQGVAAPLALAPARDNSLPVSALAGSDAIRTLAEPVAAVARLGGNARVLIAGCRPGDGATTVGNAIALELAQRLGLETLLIDAVTPMRRNGQTPGVHQSGAAHLWTAHYAAAWNEPVEQDQNERGDVLEEIRRAIRRYRAAVIDAGVVRVDARMLALARPEDPVLVVARYGCTRREELAATVEIVRLANCRLGGVILNGYQSPALDRLRWITGLRVDRDDQLGRLE